MKRLYRFTVLAVVSVLVLAIALPALATEDTSEGGTTDTTVAPEQISEGEGPAVPAPPLENKEVEQPWTVRFIYPTLAAVTVLLLIGLALGYNRSVRNRYTVAG